MEITQHPGGELLELRLNGRIDAAWGEHLSTSIDKAVRAGSHHLALNCSGVDYISSLGIGVIVTHYKMLKSVNGSLVITQPSKFVRQILDTVGLTNILIEGAAEVTTSASPAVHREVRGGAAYEVHPQLVAEPLSCTLIGEPAKLTTTGFSAADCRSVMFPRGTFGLGLGAFGTGFADCESRFGEFLAAGGCALTLPTSGDHAVPDYLIQEGKLIPRVETLYALAGAGDFSTMVRFDALADGSGKLGGSELMTTLLDLSSAPAIGFVVLAEATCIVGTSLLKSPALGPVDHDIPGVRDWLSFTTERVSEKNLALLVGVAARNISGEAAAFLRPIRPDSTVCAHVHAAVFDYRPVQRGELPFAGTVSKIIASSNPKALLHLMADSRPFDGVGETDLARGACWMGPLTTIGRG
ncbi:MAG TPA: STAS domain-containing protein [Acidobacteriaceae bacterium]|jgi:anti-sigma B factor antagonist|nr:STAS domain-containing protein [Acidobacteriaceae bacterium]